MRNLAITLAVVLGAISAAKADQAVRLHQGSILMTQTIVLNSNTAPGWFSCYANGVIRIYLRDGRAFNVNINHVAGNNGVGTPDCDDAESNVKSRAANYVAKYINPLLLNKAKDVLIDVDTQSRYQFILDLGLDNKNNILTSEISRIAVSR